MKKTKKRERKLASKMMYDSDWLLTGYSSRKWIADFVKTYHIGRVGHTRGNIVLSF